MSGWFWGRSDAITVRPAEPTDRPVLTALLAGTWRRHGVLAVEEQVALLSSGASLLALQGAEAVGFLGLAPREQTFAPTERWMDMAMVAASADLPPARVLQPLLAAIAPAWRGQPLTGVVCLTAQDWLIRELKAAGFCEEDRVLSYVRRASGLSAQSPRVCELRNAKAGYIEAVLDLNAAAFEPLWRYDRRVVLSWLLLADHAVVAEVAGRPVGFALTTLRVADANAQLIRVATHPAYRGQGIGRQLVMDAIRYATGQGAAGLWLNTQSSNAPARHLYAALGFRPTGDALSVMIRRF
ncbi:MAG: GNAT family N-acetyltransferase [Anaerolineae bacterium]|nr:GNAT family N-acetyltransferase [Anaerolineae bacterium]